MAHVPVVVAELQLSSVGLGGEHEPDDQAHVHVQCVHYSVVSDGGRRDFWSFCHSAWQRWLARWQRQLAVDKIGRAHV